MVDHLTISLWVGSCLSDWKSRKITAIATMELLGVKRNTFYRLVKDYEDKNI